MWLKEIEALASIQRNKVHVYVFTITGLVVFCCQHGTYCITVGGDGGCLACLVFCALYRNDWWLPVGMAGFIAGLFVRRMFGSTEYQYWVMQVSGQGWLAPFMLGVHLYMQVEISRCSCLPYLSIQKCYI